MGGIFLNLKTKEQIRNEYWMKFLKSGRIEDYIMYNRYNNLSEEIAEIGVIDDNNKQEENRRGSNKIN